jgi:hypothetical protein
MPRRAKRQQLLNLFSIMAVVLNIFFDIIPDKGVESASVHNLQTNKPYKFENLAEGFSSVGVVESNDRPGCPL